MLPREVRGCFFKEGILHFQLAVQPFELPKPGPLRYLQRRLIPGVLFAIGPDPVTQRRLADPELAGHIRDSARGFHHHPRRFVTELRREFPVLPCHSVPSFPVKTLKDPQSGKKEAPYCRVRCWRRRWMLLPLGVAGWGSRS